MTPTEPAFIVGDKSTTTETVPVLGHVERRCNQCHHPWEPGQEGCPKCRSQVFDEIVIKPTLIQRVAGKIMGVEAPAKPVIRPLEPDDIAVFEAAAAAGRAYAKALQAADQRARAIVNSDRASGSMVYLQARLDAISNMAGDFAPSNMTTSQALPALALASLVDNMVAQHATEVNT